MASAPNTIETVRAVAGDKYKYGFVTDIETETAPKGLSEDTIRFISAKKSEPQWLLDWRLRAFRSERHGHATGRISRGVIGKPVSGETGRPVSR